MPTIDLTDDEYAAVTAAIRRAIEESGFRAPRLPAARGARKVRRSPSQPKPPPPKTPPAVRGDKRRGERPN